MIAALGRYCTGLRTLRLESYEPAPGPDGAPPDLGELAVLTTLQALQLTCTATDQCAGLCVTLPTPAWPVCLAHSALSWST